MQQKDCILVLGSGVTPNGDLTLIGKSRVEKSVELYQRGSAKRILFCGGYFYKLSTMPKKTEAQAMRDYACTLGIPKEHCFLEEDSRETIGNAYFAKKFLERQNWRSFFVITSNYHLPKTEFAFKKVFGKEFSFELVPSLTYLSTDEIIERLDSEKEKIQRYKGFLTNVLDGDDRAVAKAMSQLPWYAQILKTISFY